MERPEREEYSEFYAGYVSKVPETDILSVLTEQPGELRKLLGGISDAEGHFAYAEGKWTIKEVLGHILDAERVFAYRAFRFSHGDETPLAGFDQDLYVANGRSNGRSLAEMLEAFELQRRANVIFFSGLRDDEWLHKGTASSAPVSVRALAYIMAGHVRHHLHIFRDRYLP